MNIIGLVTLTKKELMRFLRVPFQTVGSPIITTLLYFAVFGLSVGRFVGEIDGLSYIQFIMPGLIMMNLLNTAFTGISSGIMLSKLMNTLSDILVTPLSHLEIILGFTLSSVIRSIFTAILIYITALFFLPFEMAHPLYLILFTVLVAFAFSLFGLIVGIWAENFEQITIIPTLFLMPLSFLGGVFYSIKMLPPLFQQISYFNPLLYMISGMRYGFYGVSDVNPWAALGFLALLTAALTIFTVYLFSVGYKIRT